MKTLASNVWLATSAEVASGEFAMSGGSYQNSFITASSNRFCSLFRHNGGTRQFEAVQVTLSAEVLNVERLFVRIQSQ